MKRQIIVSNSDALTNDDYINFIEQCYKSWSVCPTTNLKLIIEYRDNFDLQILWNTQYEYIWGVSSDMSVSDIKKFVTNNLEMQCKNYIIATIRNKKVEDYKIIKRVAH